MTKIDEIFLSIDRIAYFQEDAKNSDPNYDIVDDVITIKQAIQAQRKADIEKAAMLGLAKTLSATFIQDIQKEILGEDA